MKKQIKILSAAALAATIAFSGCAVTESGVPDEREKELPAQTVTEEETVPQPSEEVETQQPPEEETEQRQPIEEEVKEEESEEVIVVQPTVKTVTYIKVTADGVNLRKGAGTSYASLGAAQRDTLYACAGESGNWYKTYYKNSVAYISKKYCAIVEMNEASAVIEKIIAEGCKCLGVKYVYGATRYHNGNGKLLSGFTTSAFDCSSLMQYIFKKGADINLQVNTRTQVVQGTAVARSDLRRGDLIFFTNASRVNNQGVERIGHVALYLGDNYILHTSSDFAKIEQMSSTRWGYYVQARRMV